MKTQSDRATSRLVRTSVLVPSEVDKALRAMCEGKRPLSWEIREALENHIRKEAP